MLAVVPGVITLLGGGTGSSSLPAHPCECSPTTALKSLKTPSQFTLSMPFGICYRNAAGSSLSAELITEAKSSIK